MVTGVGVLWVRAIYIHRETAGHGIMIDILGVVL